MERKRKNCPRGRGGCILLGRTHACNNEAGGAQRSLRSAYVTRIRRTSRRYGHSRCGRSRSDILADRAGHSHLRLFLKGPGIRPFLTRRSVCDDAGGIQAFGEIRNARVHASYDENMPRKRDARNPRSVRGKESRRIHKGPVKMGHLSPSFVCKSQKE